MKRPANSMVRARKVIEHVNGAPVQPGQEVVVRSAIDRDVYDVAHLIGRRGHVYYLEYSCGSGQSYPGDPMIGVRLEGGSREEFWKEELAQ